MGEPCPANTGGGGTGGNLEVDAINDNTNATGFSFSPPNLHVSMGDTVVFKNLSNGPHSILFTSGVLNGTLSPVFGSGNSWSQVMSTMGTFTYECGVHGPPMVGSIVVS
jgi:plastocyanin